MHVLQGLKERETLVSVSLKLPPLMKAGDIDSIKIQKDSNSNLNFTNEVCVNQHDTELL